MLMFCGYGGGDDDGLYRLYGALALMPAFAPRRAFI